MRYLVIFTLLFQLGFSKKNDRVNILDIKDETKNIYLKKYGTKALLRLNYLIKLVDNIKDKSELQKIYEINRIVNKALHYVDDQRLWNKNNYWADPLESIGMGYGDSEDIALLKMILLIKLDLPFKNMKLVQKSIKLVDKKGNPSKENIALAYYTHTSKNPIILDHKLQKGKNIYRLKGQYTIRTINDIQQKGLWEKFFEHNGSNDILVEILNKAK